MPFFDDFEKITRKITNAFLTMAFKNLQTLLQTFSLDNVWVDGSGGNSIKERGDSSNMWFILSQVVGAQDDTACDCSLIYYLFLYIFLANLHLLMYFQVTMNNATDNFPYKIPPTFTFSCRKNITKTFWKLPWYITFFQELHHS